MTTMRKLPLPRLAIIGTVGVPARYGGFETLAQQLVVELGDRYDMQVYNSGPAYEAGDRPREWGGARLVYLPLRANGLQSIAYDGLSMLHALFTCQALLVLGVSGCMFLPLFKLFSRKRIIVNVDGLEWRRPKWGWFARHFLRWSESIAARYADEIITDNAAIQKYMLDRHGRTSRLITYGSDHVQPVKIKGDAFQDYPFLQSDYAFKVCRIEPENMLDMILEAFAQQAELPLVLVGNWDHSEYGKALRAQYESYAHLHLLDPIYEPQRLNLLRSNCSVYVHGHSAGGTNPSLIEAMYLGLPVLAYGVIYNRLSSCHEAVYFDSAEELQQLLSSLDKVELQQLGQRMRAIAQRDYNWAGIANAYAEAVHGEVAAPTPVFNFELPLALRQTF